jgi:hypothetical protein
MIGAKTVNETKKKQTAGNINKTVGLLFIIRILHYEVQDVYKGYSYISRCTVSRSCANQRAVG